MAFNDEYDDDVVLDQKGRVVENVIDGGPAIRRFKPAVRQPEPRGSSETLRLPCDNRWWEVRGSGALPLGKVCAIYARDHAPHMLINGGSLSFRAADLIVFEALPLWVAERGYQLPMPAVVGNGRLFQFKFDAVHPGRVLELFMTLVIKG